MAQSARIVPLQFTHGARTISNNGRTWIWTDCKLYAPDGSGVADVATIILDLETGLVKVGDNEAVTHCILSTTGKLIGFEGKKEGTPTGIRFLRPCLMRQYNPLLEIKGDEFSIDYDNFEIFGFASKGNALGALTLKAQFVLGAVVPVSQSLDVPVGTAVDTSDTVPAAEPEPAVQPLVVHQEETPTPETPEPDQQ